MLYPIREGDGLSKMVCMRCIATLEFFCDFYDNCHRTQPQLLQRTESVQEFSKIVSSADLESDKENAPPTNDACVRPNGSITLSESDTRKSEKYKEPIYKVYDSRDVVELNIKNINSTGQAKNPCASRTKRKSRRIESKATKLKPSDNNIMQINSNDDNVAMNLSKDSLRTNSTLKSKTTINAKINTCKISVDELEPRKGSTKHNIPKINPNLGEVHENQSGGKSEDFSDSNNRKSDNCRETSSKMCQSTERHHNRDSLTLKSNSTNISFCENVKEENSNGSQLNCSETLVDSASVSNICKTIDQRRTEVQSIDRKVRNEKFLAEKSKAVPVIVKQERAECQVPKMSKITESDQLSHIPKKGEEISSSRSQKSNAKLSATSLESGAKGVGLERQDNATKSVSSTKPSIDDRSISRKSVIESLKTTLTNSDVPMKQNGEMKRSIKINSPIKNDSDQSSPTSLEPNKRSPENSENVEERRNKTEGKFGKLSELISNEQKEIIESLYRVNMQVVNDDEVRRNITYLSKDNVECNLCGMTYSRIDKCQVHVWGHLNMKPYCCKACDFVTLTVSNIRCHIRKRHLKIKPFQCHLCEKSYVTAVLLEEHINSHTGARPYKCKLCDFACSNRQTLSYHKTTHKPVKDIPCEFCPKTFYSKGRMRAHMLIHKKDKSLMCKLCSTYLCNAEALVKHYQKLHSQDYVCNICGRKTKSSKALHLHQNVHAAGKYKCPVCPNVYKSRHILKEHILKHEGIRKYKCHLCHKSFGQQSHVAAHMSVHKGKRYPCPGCKKLFNRHDNMRMHTRRCAAFQSDPELENFWSNHKTIPPVSSIEDAPISSPKKRESAPLFLDKVNNFDSKVTEEILLTEKTDDFQTEETDSINYKVSIGKTDYNSLVSHEYKDFPKYHSQQNDVIRIGEVDIFPTPQQGIVDIESEGSITITENVLRPECF